jgi:hypothetical protein
VYAAASSSPTSRWSVTNEEINTIQVCVCMCVWASVIVCAAASASHTARWSVA